MRRAYFLSMVAGLGGLSGIGTPAMASDCAARLAAIEQRVAQASFSANRNIARKRIEEARAALAAGDEQTCQMRVTSAEGAMDQQRRNRER